MVNCKLKKTKIIVISIGYVRMSTYKHAKQKCIKNYRKNVMLTVLKIE